MTRVYYDPAAIAGDWQVVFTSVTVQTGTNTLVVQPNPHRVAVKISGPVTGTVMLGVDNTLSGTKGLRYPAVSGTFRAEYSYQSDGGFVQGGIWGRHADPGPQTWTVIEVLFLPKG